TKGPHRVTTARRRGAATSPIGTRHVSRRASRRTLRRCVMTDPARVRKHSERVRELVASAVRTQVKDPRLGMITITDARLTGDLREATVFYTVLGDASAKADTATALDSAKGLLRSTVGRALGLRHAPSLAFVLDEVPDHAKQIDELLAVAQHADAEVQRRAAGAQVAGGPQPYKGGRTELDDAPGVDDADITDTDVDETGLDDADIEDADIEDPDIDDEDAGARAHHAGHD